VKNFNPSLFCNSLRKFGKAQEEKIKAKNVVKTKITIRERRGKPLHNQLLVTNKKRSMPIYLCIKMRLPMMTTVLKTINYLKATKVKTMIAIMKKMELFAGLFDHLEIRFIVL